MILAIKIRRALPGHLALKGGGLLRLVFGGHRFSKDLDYECSTPDAPRVSNAIRRAARTAKEYLAWVRSTELKTVKRGPTKSKVKISATCDDGMVLHATIEISNRSGSAWSISQEQIHARIRNQYKLPNETLDCLSSEIAFAEKILALADPNRMKARDVVDIALLARIGVRLEFARFCEVASERGKEGAEVLRVARENARNAQMLLNFREEVVPTLLPENQNDLFEDSLSETEAFLRQMEAAHAS